MKLLIERGQGAEIAIPRGHVHETCPVTALQQWLTAAELVAGPVFRKVSRGGAVGAGWCLTRCGRSFSNATPEQD
jgi:hypothetical protein